MRNFNDFIRGLGGIHNVLSGIAGKIDLIPAGGSGSSSDDYSTTERQVGTWLDGETPVYEKVIQGDALPAQYAEIAHGITNLDKVISIIGMSNYLDDGTTVWGSLLSRISEIYVLPTSIKVGGSSGFVGRPYIIILRYTKTSE